MTLVELPAELTGAELRLSCAGALACTHCPGHTRPPAWYLQHLSARLAVQLREHPSPAQPADSLKTTNRDRMGFTV